jgi:RHS repeat-associated protein
LANVIRSPRGGSIGFTYHASELSGSTVTANLLTGLNVDEVLTRTDSAGARNFLADALGSTLALTDSTGTVQTQYTYEPFGSTTASGAINGNPFQYTGRENEANGLYYYRARYYNATLQRFISEDPLGLSGGDANFYVYTGDSPTNFIDPLGLDKKGPQCQPLNSEGFGMGLAYGGTLGGGLGPNWSFGGTTGGGFGYFSGGGGGAFASAGGFAGSGKPASYPNTGGTAFAVGAFGGAGPGIFFTNAGNSARRV